MSNSSDKKIIFAAFVLIAVLSITVFNILPTAEAVTATATPTSEGNFKQWSLPSGATYTKVAAVTTDDGNTQYIFDINNNDRQTFVFPTNLLQPGVKTINSVTLDIKAEAAVNNPTKFSLSVAKGTTSNDQPLGGTQLTTSYVDYKRVMTTNPFTSLPWTVSDINSMTTGGSQLSFGATQNTNAKEVRVTKVSLIIDYVDNTPPVITPTVSGTLGNNGWYTSNVQVSWTVTDPESAITSSTGCTTTNITTDTTGTTLTCTATSAGGTSTQSVIIKRDVTPPTINGAATTSPNANGWYNADVTVKYTASDATSGLVGSPADTIISTEGSSQSTSQTATDLAGNSATATVSGIKLDKTPPTISVPTDFKVQVPLGASTVVVDYNATSSTNKVFLSDALSGLDYDPAKSSCSPPSGSTFIVDNNVVTCQASDNAGNSATNSFHIDVIDIQLDNYPTALSVNYVIDADFANVKIIDHAANGVGSIQAQVNSTSDTTGLNKETFTETSVNSGEFTNTVSPVTGATSPLIPSPSLPQLHSSMGDRITIIYNGFRNLQTAAVVKSGTVGTGSPPLATDSIKLDSDAFYPESSTSLTDTDANRKNAGTITVTISDITSGTTFTGISLTETPAGSGTFLLTGGITVSNLLADNMAVATLPKILHVSAGDTISVTDPVTTKSATAKILAPPAALTLLGSAPKFGQNVDCALTLGDTDNDADGICDSWETSSGLKVSLDGGVTSYTYACSPLLDDPQSPLIDPANTVECPSPLHKDVYVEVDYMTNHHPDDTALLDVIKAYKKMNIYLHIQVNEDLGFHSTLTQYYTPTTIPAGYDYHDFQSLKKAFFGTSTERSLCPASGECVPLTDKSFVFHYGIFLHELADAAGSSGYAEIGGNDLAITMGPFPAHVGTHDQQAAAFMHELGHNLNLRHGGNEDLNCKPNYPSIMSYTYMFPKSSGGFIDGRILNYSGWKYSAISESKLYEGTTKSITVGAPISTVLGYYLGGTTKDPTVVTTGSVIDWDRNGLATPSGYALNVHYMTPIADCHDTTTRTLYGYNDWANLAFNFRPSGNYANGLSTIPHFDDGGSPVIGEPSPESAPLVNAGPDNSTNEGTLTTLKFPFTSYDDNFRAYVDFGDGSPIETIDGVAGGVTDVVATHTWKQDGTYTVSVTGKALYNGNTYGSRTDTMQITVNNVAPSVTAPAAQTIDEGGSISISTPFTDPGTLDTHIATIDWGDGSAVDTATVSEETSSVNPDGSITITTPGTISAGPHTYKDNSSYTVTISVTDDHDTTIANTSITVNNVAPTLDALTMNPSSPVIYGQTVTFSSTYHDIGVLDTQTASWNFGDGTTDTGAIAAGGSGSVSTTHVYTKAGDFTAKLTVKDKDGGVSNLQTIVLHVNYKSASFVSPIDNSQYQTGRTIPVKVSVLDFNNSPVPNASVTGSWDGGAPFTLTYDSVGKFYAFNYDTSSLSSGSHTLVVKTDDGITSTTVHIALK